QNNAPTNPHRTVCRNRLHARSPLSKAAALLPQLAQARRRARLVLSAQRLREVGRACPSVGASLRGALWQARSGDLVLGGMERARYQLPYFDGYRSLATRSGDAAASFPDVGRQLLR